ncbi:hypothetical protein QTH97_21875 [Variovorax sp. J22R24]|uniref:hypothetical protein n=1 Tax=Variovorax gracilis TaxID=3053502 RepID=UPI002575A4A0|nr:hypothetical protein [Variovorax sp. J22R24]MDM0107612.1 hypothetical protein [Variovorax sp. J22R24]
MLAGTGAGSSREAVTKALLSGVLDSSVDVLEGLRALRHRCTTGRILPTLWVVYPIVEQNAP